MSWSEDWNPLRQKYIFRSGYWHLAHQTLNIRCMWTNFSSFEPLQFILYRTAFHIGPKSYQVLCRHGLTWQKKLFVLPRARANLFIQAGYASYVRDKFRDLLDTHIHVSEPAWVITKCQSWTKAILINGDLPTRVWRLLYLIFFSISFIYWLHLSN